MTQKDLAVHIGKSERTVKRITVSLQQKGIMERENGKRNGKWVILLQKYHDNVVSGLEEKNLSYVSGKHSALRRQRL